MKKNIIVLLGSICFATLFHDKGLGLNCLLYALFLVTILAVYRKDQLLRTSIILSAAAMIATSVAIIMHGSSLAVTCYFLSIIGFIGYAASEKSSLYVAWMNGIYSTVIGSFHDILHNKPKPEKPETVKIKTEQLLKLIFIPIALLALFILLYSQTNPVFEAWLGKFDFSFINIGWFFIALLGGFLIANVAPPRSIESTTQLDLETPDLLKDREVDHMEVDRAKNEVQIGTFSLIALNVLLVLVLVSELVFIMGLDDLKASTLSSAVHSGVYASIASIVLAVVIIVFLFRGSVNFIKENRSLKGLSFLWIILNTALIVSILYKTFLYMENYGLSIKRLGVMVYLLLCVIGLITTYLKINNRYNLTYLFRKNVAVGFSIVMVYSCFNWSAVITRYNIENDFVHEQQLELLLPQNILVLQELGKYEDIISKTNQRYFSKWSEKDFTDRCWQDFNFIAHKMDKTTTDVSK
jgi:hypothetical protein